MIKNSKCECGHQNYVGTVLCESCGKPLIDENGTELLEMRYDGVARRSQRTNPSWIDRIWNFFSSVKIAVYIIFFTLFLSIFGTILPQESTFINMDAAAFYADEYGTLGEIYYKLGFSRTFETWWFKGLLVMIGASLVICSIDRVLPLYRALSKQQIRKHPRFLSRQKVVYSGALPEAQNESTPSKEWLEQVSSFLKKKRYRVHMEDTALLAEKNRFSRWGPYINHIGLIIFLLAVLMRYIPGWHMDEYISIMEGETRHIEGTNYYLKNEQFILDFYDEDELTTLFREEGRIIVSRYETKVILYECLDDCDIPGVEPELKEVARHDILVNHPLNYQGFLAYQIDFDYTPQILSVNVTLRDKESGQAYGTMLLNMADPEPSYEVGPYDVEVLYYYPDFDYKEGLPITVTASPNRPAFVFSIHGPDLPQTGEVFMYFPKPEDKVYFQQDRINEASNTKFELAAESMEDVEFAIYTTFLNIRVDRAMPYIWVGAAISMLGLVLGFYWQHRRIWIRIDDDQVLLGAHTNKNWYGLRHEVAVTLKHAGVEVEAKSLENGGGKS